MQPNPILTICVNYYNDEQTVHFIQALLAQRDASDQRVIVVDNSETSLARNALRDLTSTDRRIWLFTLGKNLGYFGAAAFGLHEYIKQYPPPEWIIVCNTDIDFLHEDFLLSLQAFHAKTPPAVVAPAIISTVSGRDQNPNMRTRPTWWRMHLYKWVFRHPMLLKISEGLSRVKQSIRIPRGRVSINQNSRPYPTNIYAPHGSFIIFHRSYFDAGGSLNYGVHLFGEEIFVAETARRLGLSIIYDPRLTVLHKEHATTSILPSRAILHAKAAAYCADTYFRRENREHK